MMKTVSRHLLSELAPEIASRFERGAALRIHTAFDQVQARWRAAQADCAAYGFQTYDWLATWHQTIGQRQGWEVLLVELSGADDQLLMLLPLGRRRQHGVRMVGFLGGEVTDYHAPLLRAGVEMSGFADLWPVIMRLLQGVDLFRARRMPLLLNGMMNPMMSLAGLRQTEQAHAATLTRSFDAFRQQRSSNLFADTRRKVRRLAERGHVQFQMDVPLSQRETVIAGMARQKSRRWRETDCRDLFAEPGYLQFYQELATHGLEGGEVWLSALYVDDHLIATHWGLRFQQRFYWLVSGYEDGEWARYSPGRILLEAVVRHCIDAGLDIFDLTVGDEAYKQQWADHNMPLYAGQQGYSLCGKLLVALDEARQRLRARARKNAFLRALVNRLRKWRAAASNR